MTRPGRKIGSSPGEGERPSTTAKTFFQFLQQNSAALKFGLPVRRPHVDFTRESDEV